MFTTSVAVSASRFLLGMAKRIWLVLPTLVLDPADLYNRYIRQPDWPTYDMPVWLFWIVFGLAILSGAVWTYHELRAKYEPARKPDPSDVAASKAELMQASHGVVWPAILAINEALRVGSYVYQSTWRTSESNEIATWGITSRMTVGGDLAHVKDAEWLRAHSLDAVQASFVSGLAHYRASREMLNMLCKLMLTVEQLDDRNNYHQVNRKDLAALMREWWEADVALRQRLTALSQDARFSVMRMSLRKYVSDDAHYQNTHFTAALARFWKVQ